MNTDNHFLSPILIIRIHPAQKIISYTMDLQALNNLQRLHESKKIIPRWRERK